MNNIFEIRPKVVFRKVEERFPDRNVMLSISVPSSDIGGLTLLESSILVCLVKLIGAKEIFEFGTYLGATSLLFSANSENDTKITTLDLPLGMVEGKQNISENEYLTDDKANDDYLRNAYHGKGAMYVERAENTIRAKVHRIFADSRKLSQDVLEFGSRFDMVFIDGGHDYETVKSDTGKAFEMAKDDSIIVWHDYRSNIHKDVTHFVDNFSQQRKIVYVQNTMLAICFNGCYEKLLSLN